MEKLHNIYRFGNNKKHMISHMIFKDVAFVASAVGHKYREAFQCVYATEDHLLGTNGHVLHRVPMPKLFEKPVLSPGLWYPIRRMTNQVWLIKSDTTDEFPDISMVVASKEAKQFDLSFTSNFIGNVSSVLSRFYRACEVGIGINPDLLTGVRYMNEDARIHVPDKHDAVKIECGSKEIYVIPMFLS